MYSGPFILWNFDSPEMDADDEDGCIANSGDDDNDDDNEAKAKCEKRKKVLC